MFSGRDDTNAASSASDLTILTTEHFTLQSARQLCLQDIQGRSTIFLTVLSVSLLAIGYFGTATHFGAAYIAFVLVLVTTLWVLGALTFIRVIQASVEDTIIVFGIARIRHRYTELAPNDGRLFVRTIHDDFAGINHEMGSSGSWWQKTMPTYVVISFVTSVLAGSEVAFALGEVFHTGIAAQTMAGIATFAINVAAFRVMTVRLFKNIDRFFPPLYPSTDSGSPANA